jgi:hypothetical protein
MEKVLLLPAVMAIAIISIYTIRISEQDIELISALSKVSRAHPDDSNIYLLAVRTLARAFEHGNTTQEYLAMLQGDLQLGPRILSLQQLEDGSFNIIYRESAESNRSVWVEVRYYLIEEVVKNVEAALDGALNRLVKQNDGNLTINEVIGSVDEVGNNVSANLLEVKVQVTSTQVIPEFTDETHGHPGCSVTALILVKDRSTDFGIPFQANYNTLTEWSDFSLTNEAEPNLHQQGN